MVKKILFTISFLVSTVVSFGQCVELATNFGNNLSISSYNVNGDVSIMHQNNQLIFKTASNYNTASGPDVRVYLVNSQGKTDQQIINTNIDNMPNIPFGLVTFSGAQEITVDVPNNVDLKEYDVVFFYCFQFSAFWDFGKITPIDINSCDNLSFSNLKKTDDFDVYPNPVKDILNLKGDISKIKEYKIFNSAGILVLNSNVLFNKIDVSKLANGIYSLVLLSENSFEFKKIIKI